MKQPKLVHIFQAAQRMPRSRAVEQCIISLPEIRKNYSLLPLLKLQMLSLPGSVYGLALAAVLVQQIFSFTDLPLLEVLPVTGMLHAVIVLLFSRHLMLPGTGNMSEIEKCCRYSYGQILMARLLCLCVLTLTTFLIAMLPGVVSRQELGFLLQQLRDLPVLRERTYVEPAARAACGLRRFARLDLGELCQPFGHCADDGLSGGRIGRQYDAGNDTGDGNADCLCGSAADRGGSRMARKDSDEQEELR